MHFFISHLASCLRTRRFSEPTFRPSRATNHWKNTVNRDFPTFSRICIFFLLIFSLLTLLTSAFQLSILSEVSLLNFLRPLYLITFGKPAGHREVAPREFDVQSRWKLAREAEEKRRRRRRRKEDEDKTVKRKRLVWQVLAVTILIVYQISTAPRKVAPGTMY